MLSKSSLKQGTLDWEKARTTRIGSSEVFDIVKYYSTADELLNCGIDPVKFREEKPYITAYSLYHKLLGDGLYRKDTVPPEFAVYGHAVEPYGAYILRQGRRKKLKPGGVYLSDRLIASLDIEGVTEERDLIPFANASGKPKLGQKFVCEQKTMLPQMIKNGLPFKYIIQAQYQVMQTCADYYILQLMVLDDDTPFIRGTISNMSAKKKRDYLDKHMTTSHYTFKDNRHLAQLIEECLSRFFYDVDNRNEPTPYIRNDNTGNIIESIRLNSLFDDDRVCSFDLRDYMEAKKSEARMTLRAEAEKQKMIEVAKAYNSVYFISPDGATGFFDKRGGLHVYPPKEGVRDYD